MESAEEVSEEEVFPKSMTLSWAEQLKTQIKSKHYPDIDPRTAAHELAGYKTALRDLGLLDRDDEVTEPGIFGAACEMDKKPSPEQEEALSYVCDELCRFREGRTQEELDAICEKCKLESWARGQDKKATGPSGKRIAPEENVLGVLYKQHMCKQQEAEQGPESLETPYYPGKPGHSGYSAERLTKQS